MTVFSPLKDQPHYIYRVTGRVGALLANLETRLPGMLAYGHRARDRRWNRMTKELRDNPAAEVNSYDYYKAYVPVNAAWLFEHDLAGARVRYQIEHAINVDDIFAWPSMDQAALDTMAEYGGQALCHRSHHRLPGARSLLGHDPPLVEAGLPLWRGQDSDSHPLQPDSPRPGVCRCSSQGSPGLVGPSAGVHEHRSAPGHPQRPDAQRRRDA